MSVYTLCVSQLSIWKLESHEIFQPLSQRGGPGLVSSGLGVDSVFLPYPWKDSYPTRIPLLSLQGIRAF